MAAAREAIQSGAAREKIETLVQFTQRFAKK
jgi:anthranilate phosphoribosyltransferase